MCVSAASSASVTRSSTPDLCRMPVASSARKRGRISACAADRSACATLRVSSSENGMAGIVAPEGSAGLRGQVAIVTGGARGIGLGIARRLTADGCRVIVWDRDPEGFDAKAAGFVPLSVHGVDVSKLVEVEHTFIASVANVRNVDI